MFLKRKIKCFTLIEMLVVVSIIVILSAIVVSTYRSSQNRYILESDTQTFVSNVRRIQSLGLAAQKFCSNSQEGGYGIELGADIKGKNLKKYILFADCNDNKKYDENDELIENINLNIKDSIEYCPTSSCNNLRIMIKPPNQSFSIILNGLEISSPSILIKFVSSAISNDKGYVTVNKGGYISGCIGSETLCTNQ